MLDPPQARFRFRALFRVAVEFQLEILIAQIHLRQWALAIGRCAVPSSRNSSGGFGSRGAAVFPPASCAHTEPAAASRTNAKRFMFASQTA